ncbi:transposase [Burkholderia mayonis]|uniref:transposase n=1 Tax=Burkholderia mayonis TaxID=1385591 RepID=UPI003AAF7A16
MTEHSDDLRSRLVTGFERDGRRRRFDPQAKLELVQACMQPGVSVARMALEHAVNANLLRKWIRDWGLELTRFRGHLSFGTGGACHGKAPQPLRAGISGANGRVSQSRALARRACA